MNDISLIRFTNTMPRRSAFKMELMNFLKQQQKKYTT